MEVATFVSLMDQNEKKECLKMIAKTDLKLFGDVLVEEQRAEKEKLESDLGILGRCDI